ncbi:MAG: TFIIB-type zinc ribbon-containing protein [Christensenellaceae bacterium]|nr:TFIIB-type zinc ribbon-containing protein [Christensenellaceae bacterium]
MSASMTYKCPSCGGYLEFDPARQRFACPYCGRAYDEAELGQPQTTAQETPMQAPSGMRGYHCQMCGAEIVVGETTAATRCYYCHNPVVLTDRLSEEFRPDGVVPFCLQKKEAEQRFRKFVERKTFIDREFFSTAQLEDFSGVYYPYWYGDVEGAASFDGEGTRTSVVVGPRETVTTTRVFRVNREGRLTFRNMARKGLSSVDRQLSDGIHPYRMEELKEFSGAYLSGFLAERRDIDKADVQAEMEKEANGYAASLMRSGGSFNSLTGRTSFRADKARMRSVLLPAWVLTYKSGKDGSPYYYMMNGQTGAICGKLPINWKKLLLTAAGIGAGVFALLCAGGLLLW